MKKRIIIVIVALVVVFGSIFAYNIIRGHMIQSFFKNRPQPPVTVAATQVKTQQWPTKITASGDLEAKNGVQITPQQNGQVVNIMFDSGDMVKKGQPLVKQDTQLDKATLQKQIAALKLAKINEKRQQRLVKKGVASQADLDKARSNLAQAKAQVMKTKTIIRQKTIRAPFTGKIGLDQTNAGQYLTTSSQIAYLRQLSPLHVNFDVPQQDLPKLSVGNTIKLKTNAYPGQTFPAKITAINSQVNDQTRNITIQGTVPNPDNKLAPGMFVNVSVRLPGHNKVITVPQTAISFNLYGDIVYILHPTDKKHGDDNKKVYKVEQKVVQVKRRRGNEAAISKGLKPGDLVVTAGQIKLDPDSKAIIDKSVNMNDKQTATSAQ